MSIKHGIYFYSQLKPTTQPVDHASPGAVHCAQCARVIGAVDNRAEGYRLFKWALSLPAATSHNSKVTSSAYPLDNFISAQLLSLISSQAIRKFILHSASSMGMALHLWVFASHISYSSSSSKGPPTAQPAMKIFYKILTPSILSVKLEEQTLMSDEEVLLPEDVVETIWKNLSASTQNMPRSARKFQDWDVGMLHRFE